ncbi:asparagine synthase (glutamine-hydrolyzing) [Thalassoglobus polymorphus]|uniref:asparagine synthase (glutamine-hydrolyzing) n=1 Tax=Thalassoglobus polymorphus TaxID=2527994 RepID=A0A517QSN4_9PLAN|nr:asparagine synthase (glutamine-hydrolyzing) [Thalassoglobus polymorphus]QDT34648.1 Asparagine synthetase [glutamine-hydrolyzing] 1 [Thalassoglobus polymorphus]
MCGIAGVLFADGAQPVEEVRLREMADSIAHRGPDAEGIWKASGIGLAHRRLSIIDLSDGNQPIANEDGSVQVVFNGEIYNYRELQSELIAKGHRFRTNSDTEVLVHLYEEMGVEFVKRLRGMFAVALWDVKRQRLVLARDRVGQKPLYYFQDEKRVLFGSEIKAILSWGNIPREINLEALESYLTFGVVPGELSIFRNIHKLPAATTLVIDRNNWRATPQKYWQLNFEPDESKSLDQWIEELSNKFDETTDAHRIADVPVGAFLSGGVDSSAVVGSLMQSGTEAIKTFSIGFEEEAFSELPYAKIIAEKFQTEHIEETVTSDAVAGLADLVHYYDEPFADSSAIPTMAVCKVAHEHVKVVLSGDGGDEAFGGYSRYAHDLKEAKLRALLPQWFRKSILHQAAIIWPKADWLPRPMRLKTALTNLSLKDDAAYANTISLCRPDMRRELLRQDVSEHLNGYHPEDRIIRGFQQGNTSPLNGMLSADTSMLLPDDFLTKVDRASMAVGLEVRPPMVDHEFLELASKVPSSLKVKDGETKWIFKKACEKRLPLDIIWRRKQGFEIPADDWLRGPLREIFESQVLSQNSQVANFIEIKTAKKLYNAHLNKTGRYGSVLWSLLVLGCWMNHWCSE